MELIKIEDANISTLASINYITKINGQYVKVIDKSERGIADILITNNQNCIIYFDDDEVTFYNKDNAKYYISMSITDFSLITIL